MRGFFASCALAALLLAAASADHHEHHDHEHHHHHEGDMSCHKLSPPNADFGFNLYKRLNADASAGQNIFFSPLGISTALAMLSAGAKGETLSQLFTTLGYSALDQNQVNEAYKHLFHMFEHSQSNQLLQMGNRLAVRPDGTLLPDYVKAVEQFYTGSVVNQDFSNPAEAAAALNKFIADKTNNMIKDVVKDLDPDTFMVLINYIFFRGQWEKPFDGNYTAKAEFNVDANTKVEVDMMKRTGRYDLYQDADNHTTVIMLPYKGNTSMMVVLPDEGKMQEVEGYINKDYIRHWHDSLYRGSVDLLLPKFSISASASLENTLKTMGVVDAFSDNADLSGISETKLKVSKVSHKAMLSVDETGTEAAAATTIEVMPMSMPEMVTLDRPFLVFILEHSTRSILFMGKISDPTAA